MAIQFPKTWAGADQLNFAALEKKYKLPEGSLETLCAIESSGDPNAKRGASKGLFQLEEAAWEEARKINPALPPLPEKDSGEPDPRLNPQYSAEAGAAYFSLSLRRNGGDIASAIAGYNASAHNPYTQHFDYAGKGGVREIYARRAATEYLPKAIAYLSVSGRDALAATLYADALGKLSGDDEQKFKTNCAAFETSFGKRTDLGLEEEAPVARGTENNTAKAQLRSEKGLQMMASKSSAIPEPESVPEEAPYTGPQAKSSVVDLWERQHNKSPLKEAKERAAAKEKTEKTEKSLGARFGDWLSNVGYELNKLKSNGETAERGYGKGPWTYDKAKKERVYKLEQSPKEDDGLNAHEEKILELAKAAEAAEKAKPGKDADYKVTKEGISWAITRDDDVVKAIQKALGQEKIDGKFGNATGAAWNTFHHEDVSSVSVGELKTLLKAKNVDIKAPEKGK